MRSDMSISARTATSLKEGRAVITGTQTSKGIGTPPDLASVIALLASDGAPSTTGDVTAVDPRHHAP